MIKAFWINFLRYNNQLWFEPITNCSPSLKRLLARIKLELYTVKILLFFFLVPNLKSSKNLGCWKNSYSPLLVAGYLYRVLRRMPELGGGTYTILFPLSTFLNLFSFFFSLIFSSNRVLICAVYASIYLCCDTEPETMPTNPKGYIIRPEIILLVWIYLGSFAPNSRE